MAGDHSAASLAEENLRVARAIGNPSFVAWGLFSLGYTLQLDDPERSIECLRDGIEQFRLMDSPAMVEFCLVMLIRLEAQHSDSQRALASFRAGLDLSVETGNRANVIYHIKNGALALSRAGRPDVAAVCLGFVDVQPQRGNAGWEGEFLEDLAAEIRAARGDAAYFEATARGGAMSYDEIVEYARHEIGSALALTDPSAA
jgi:hypothetical protein